MDKESFFRVVRVFRGKEILFILKPKRKEVQDEDDNVPGASGRSPGVGGR